MKHTLLSLLMVICSLSFTYGQSNSSNGDPDVPGFLNSRIDKGEYLRLRDENINMLRGLPYVNAGIERQKAIDVMEKSQMSKPSSVNYISWTPLGPAPIPNGQTNSTVNSVTGRITCIAIDPSNPSIVYCGAAQGGVYRTTDDGAHWTAIFDNAQSLAIGSIAIAPSDHTIVYVGTGEPNLSIDSFFGVGLYRIDNATTTADLVGPINPSITTGTTTPVTYNCFTGRAISKILVDPSDPATIFVSTASGLGGIAATALNTVPPMGLRGVFRSTNATSAPGSVSFSKLIVTTAGGLDVPSTGNRSVMDMVFDPSTPSTILASVYGGVTTPGDGGVYLSTNALTATPSFSQTLQLAAGIRSSFSITKISSTVTVLCATGESSGSLRRSIDGGSTWSSPISGVTGFCDGQCWYDIVASMDPTNTNNILMGGSATGASSFVVKQTTNGGTTWLSSDNGLHADVHAIERAPSNSSIVYTGNDGGIFRSTDGGSTWSSVNGSGISATQFQSLAIHPTDPYFTIGGSQDNGTEFLQPTDLWTRADYGDGGFSLIDQNAANTTAVTMYHTYFNQTSNLIGLARVTNTACATDGEWVFRGYGYTYPVTGCEGVAYAANNGIGGTDATLFYAPMALGPGNPNTVYFGTDRLYRSTNRGDNMTLVSQGPLQTGYPVTAIGIAPHNDSIRIVGVDNGKVYATRTASSTLTDITSPSFPVNPSGSTVRFVSRAVVDPNNSTIAYVTFSYYATAGQGVWKTTDMTSSAAWTAIGTGIPSIPINAFVVDPSNSNNLFAGTDIGVYYSTNGGTSWASYSSGLPRVAVFDMAITSDRTLRIATHGRGMWEANELPLPIEMSSLSAHIVDANNVQLDWSTVTETNNYGFYIERRGENSAGYTTVSQLIPGNGTSLTPHDYTWTDAKVNPGVYFYRIQQVDLQGGKAYSNPITMTITGVLSVHNANDRYEFSLSQNYPNPFNPTTTINFSVEKQEHAAIRIFNSLGQEVVKLYDGIAEPGRTYSLKLDASSLSSGVYICQIATESHLSVRKMLLQK
ncbi:MAG: T9SS type A sorting domain-containing protein [Bacteroidota bacterium]